MSDDAAMKIYILMYAFITLLYTEIVACMHMTATYLIHVHHCPLLDVKLT